MSEITALAAKYARQLAVVEEISASIAKAEEKYQREQADLEDARKQLQALVGAVGQKKLIPIGFNRYVLVQRRNGQFGAYTLVDIIEDSK